MLPRALARRGKRECLARRPNALYLDREVGIYSGSPSLSATLSEFSEMSTASSINTIRTTNRSSADQCNPDPHSTSPSHNHSNRKSHQHHVQPQGINAHSEIKHPPVNAAYRQGGKEHKTCATLVATEPYTKRRQCTVGHLECLIKG